MIVPKPLDRAVLEHRKTQHREPVTTVAMLGGGHVTTCRYTPGASVSVQRQHGVTGFGRVEIIAVARHTLGDIDLPGVRAEGWRTTPEFADYWMTRHDNAWPPTEACATCGPFDIDDEHCPACGALGGRGRVAVAVDDADVLARFHKRHGDTQVWAVMFRLLQDSPLLLAKDSSRGYTRQHHDAMPHEPEAVDAGALHRYTEDAAERFAGLPGRREQALKAHARSLANRLRQAAVHADRQGLDALAELQRIEEHITILERQRGTR